MLNINDKHFIHIGIYIYIYIFHGCVWDPGFHALRIHQTVKGFFLKKDQLLWLIFFSGGVGRDFVCVYKCVS